MVGSSRGFTLVETVIVLALLTPLILVGSFSLFRSHQRIAGGMAQDALVSDMRFQQRRAIEGNAGADQALSDYSIRFEEDRYILFKGAVYEPGNAENTAVGIDPPWRLTAIAFPDQMITFARITGDVRNFSDIQHALTLENSQTGEQKVIELNRRGIVSGETSP